MHGMLIARHSELSDGAASHRAFYHANAGQLLLYGAPFIMIVWGAWVTALVPHM